VIVFNTPLSFIEMSIMHQHVRLSLLGPPGSIPTLIDLTFDSEDLLEDFIRSTFDTEPPVSHPKVDVPKLDVIAPVQVFRRSLVRGDEDDRMCTICYDEFRTRKHVRRLPCGHLFCAKCIAKWTVKHSATCPTCREALS